MGLDAGPPKLLDHEAPAGGGLHGDGRRGLRPTVLYMSSFPSGSGGKPPLVRGHRPLKSSKDNSHQAFKNNAWPEREELHVVDNQTTPTGYIVRTYGSQL
jgi:hypothetical protein